MIVEFAFGKENTKQDIKAPDARMQLSRIQFKREHFILVRIIPLSERLIDVEKIFVTCGGFDTTYPIDCTIHPIPLSDERNTLCHRQSGDLSGIVYGSIVCYFKLPGLREVDTIKGAMQYTSR